MPIRAGVKGFVVGVALVVSVLCLGHYDLALRDAPPQTGFPWPRPQGQEEFQETGTSTFTAPPLAENEVDEADEELQDKPPESEEDNGNEMDHKEDEPLGKLDKAGQVNGADDQGHDEDDDATDDHASYEDAGNDDNDEDDNDDDDYEVDDDDTDVADEKGNRKCEGEYDDHEPTNMEDAEFTSVGNGERKRGSCQKQKRSRIGQLAQEELEKKRSKPVVELEESEVPVECKQMWMSKPDMYGFIKLLTTKKINQYIEYGGGGSTLCAARLVNHVTTFEHNQQWCDNLKSTIKEANVTNVNLVCSPVTWHFFGDTPYGDGSYTDFKSYVDTIHSLGIKHFDFAFIDGRARTACAKVLSEYLSGDSTLAIHDWQREHYHEAVLELYEELDVPFQLDRLGVLKKKKETSV